MNIYEAIVIGSGPSGVIGAQKLIDNNINTLLIDAGFDVKESSPLTSNEKQESHNLVDGFHKNLLVQENFKTKFNKNNLIQNKLNSFGYSKYIDFDLSNIDYNPTLLKGGLSNVWGGSILPLRKEDFTDWPIQLSDMKKYYKYAMSYIGAENYDDDLNKIFSLENYDQSHKIDRSIMVDYILGKYKIYKKKLNLNGIFIGNSRIAVEKQSCPYCINCNLNDKFPLIFNSSNNLRKLEKNNLFKYKKNNIVEKIIENEKFITIFCKDLDNNEFKYRCKRLYIGAGFLSTSKIMLDSYKAKNIQINQIEAKDSQYFILPAILLRNLKKNQNKINFSQLFIEIFNKDISNNYAHLQIYTYNNLVDDYIKHKYFLFYKILYPFIKNFIRNRIIFIQGYLHNKDSSKASIKFENINGSQKYKIEIKKNDKTDGVIRKIISLLAYNFYSVGFFPLSFLMRIGKFGAGHHSGATFPMKKIFKKNSSNLWGVPYGFTKVHIIDSSVLPSINSSTITLTVMANAARIADNHNNFK